MNDLRVTSFENFFKASKPSLRTVIIEALMNVAFKQAAPVMVQTNNKSFKGSFLGIDNDSDVFMFSLGEGNIRLVKFEDLKEFTLE